MAIRQLGNSMQSLGIILLLSFVTLCFSVSLNAWFSNNILPFLTDVDGSKITRWAFISFCLCAIVAIIRQILYRYCYKRGTLVLLIYLVAVYWYFRIKFKYIAHPTIIYNLGYGDILTILISISVLVSIFSIYRKHRKDNGKGLSNRVATFHIDRPIDNPDDDKLEYDDLAKLISSSIRKSDIENSYSVALVGSWGVGKSSFINLMEKYFPSNTYKVIRFNPRHARSVSLIQDDFFEFLSNELSQFDGEFTSTLHRYLDSISMFNGNVVAKIILDIETSINTKDSKKSLSSIIARHWKKVIVIMEDFDRLVADELIEVLKLIDRNAAIGGLVFICAFDREHIAEVFKDKGSRFIDKYFDVELPIPSRPYTAIYKYIEQRLILIFGEDENIVQSEVQSCYNILYEYVKTFRDAKRLTNQMELSYDFVKKDVEIVDFLLVNIVKLYAEKAFAKLSSYNFAKEWEGTNEENKQKLLNHFPECKSILSYLMHRPRTLLSFNNPSAYYVYIWNYVFGKLRVSQLQKLMDLSFPFEEDFGRYLSSNYGGLILDYLKFQEPANLPTVDSLTRYIELIAYPFIWNPIGDYDSGFYRLMTKMLSDHTYRDINHFLGISLEAYRNIFIKILTTSHNGLTPVSLNRALAFSSLSGAISSEILPHSKILKINIDNLKKYSIENPVFSNIHYSMLLGCVDYIESKSRKVVLNPISCQLVRRMIEAAPAAYFEGFVRLMGQSSSEDFNQIGCEGFWKQIFNSPIEIEDVINHLSDDYLIVKNFWILYKANNYEPIQFDADGSVQAKIDHKLKNEINRYNLFLQKKAEYQDLIKKKQNHKISWSFLDKRVKEIRDTISSEIRLNLKEISDFLSNLA